MPSRRLAVAVLAAVAVLHLCPGCGTTPKPPTSLPLELVLLGGGVGDTTNLSPEQVFENIKGSEFSFYVNEEGTRVPVDGLGVTVVGYSGDPEWAPADVDFLLLRKVSADGSISLLPIASIEASTEESDLVRVSMKGARMARVSARLQWDVDPQFYATPPGVLQDVYVVSSATVTTITTSTVKGGLKVNVDDVAAQANIEESTAAAFHRAYSNAILGRWQTKLPEEILGTTPIATIDLVKGAAHTFQLPGNRPVQFRITSVDAAQELVSFRFGDTEHTDVPIGQFRALNDWAGVRLVSLIPPPEQGKAPRMTLVVHTIDRAKASGASVTVRFVAPPPNLRIDNTHRLRVEPTEAGKVAYGFEFLLRNPGSSVATVSEVRAVLNPHDPGAFASIERVSGAYITFVDRDLNSTTKSDARQYIGRAWYPSPDGSRMIVISPTTESVPGNTAQTLLLIVEFDQSALRRPISSVEFSLSVNGGAVVDSGRVSF